MRESIRLIAHDIILIGGALCILIVLLLFLIRFRISYQLLQTGKTIRNALQIIVETIVNPATTLAYISKLIDNHSHKKPIRRTNKKSLALKKSPKK